MNDQLLEILYTALGTVLTGAIGYGFIMLRAWLSSKIKNEELREVSNATVGIIEDVVMTIQQTVVEELKKDGNFNKEEAKGALYAAKVQALSLMSAHTKALIAKYFGDVEVWLTNQIEAIIGRQIK